MCGEPNAGRTTINIVLVIFLVIYESEGDSNVCPSSADDGVVWPQTEISSCTKSDPLCVSENMEIAFRCCDAYGSWKEPPSCYYIQRNIESPCPDNVTHWTKSVCIIAIEDTTYPPVCPYEETLPFFDYIESVDGELLPVWMPVVRNTGKYGVGLLHWVEPTADYGSPYTSCGDNTCRSYRFNKSIIDKNCLIFYNTSYVKAVPCNEKYTAICAYRSLPDRTNSFCSQSHPSCMQSDYSTRSKCFCKGSANSDYVKAEFVQPYQNLIFDSLSSETCHIGLKKDTDGTYIWPNKNLRISYTDWAEEVVFGEDYTCGTISKSGWVLTKTRNEGTCDLYEVEVPIKENKISLDYDETNKQFIVKLANPSNWLYNEEKSVPMVFCFTDAIQDALVYKVEVSGSVMGDHAVFYFQPHGDGPGTYWCEAFPYPDASAKRSNEYLLRYTDSFTEEYVVLLKTSYVRGSNPLTEANMKSIRENLANQMDALQTNSNFYPRIYKIVNIDEDNSEMTINFHMVNPTKAEPLKQYSPLRGYMEQSLTNFTFVNMFGVDSCVGIQSGNIPSTVTWPVTDINVVAVKPREGYCIKSDGSIISRACNGNYIDGAQWEELPEPCTIQQSTNITVNLTNILVLNKSEDYIYQVADILESHYLELVPLDVHLVSMFLAQVAESDTGIDLNLTVKIISKLMDVPQSILRQSQILFNATDRILYYTDRIIENSGFIGDILEENLMIISYFVKEANLSGAVINNVDEIYYNIYKMYNEFDLEKIMKDEELKAAIVLSEELLTQVLKTNQKSKIDKSRIIITVFKNSNLFNEPTESFITTSIIIGVQFPDLEDEFSGKIFTIHNDSNADSNFNCSHWNFDLGEKKGIWQSEGFTDYSKSSIICSYNRLTHLTIARKIEVNITLELEAILASDRSLQEKLENTSSLLKTYLERFQPLDVMLLSQLFNKVVVSDEDNLELVADILDKIVGIPPKILQRSRILYNATGKLLVYFEQILQKSDGSHLIQRENFYIVVQKLDEKTIYGFTLTNCKVKCNLTILQEETFESEVSTMKDLDTALLLGQVLLEQIISFNKQNYQPKLVLTIFFTDALFIEDNKTIEIVTRIVGVFIPDFDDPLNGGINFLYNVDRNFASNYSCSVYSNDADDTTAQKGFWNSESPPTFSENFLECQFWNPKYFALTHSMINFTSSLQNMLNSQEPVRDILSQTDLIIKNYYTYLNSIDVFIISQLLSKVEEVDEEVLQVCLRIVSYAMYISRDTLNEAQENSQATDLILYHIKRISTNTMFNQNIVLLEDNVALVVSLLSETGVHGLGLEKCDFKCEITLLHEEDATPTDVAHYDAVLKIDPGLLNQLIKKQSENYTPKLVSVIFYTNALFNEGNDAKATNTIFGVYFPNFNDILSREYQLYFHPHLNISSNYSCFNWNYQADENFKPIKGSWDYDSRAREDEMLFCNFYSNGYSSLIEGYNNYYNMSDTLIKINATNTSFSEKLYRVEDTLYYYWEFQPIDVYLLSEIFSQCDSLSNDELDRVNIIINNLIRISNNILIESENSFNALRHILRTINDMASFASSHQHSLINDHFGLVICELSSSTSLVGVTVTQNEVSCFTNETEDSFSSPDTAIAGLTLSKELLNQTLSLGQATKIIVIVLLDNIFFNSKELRNTSVILGVFIPNFNEKLDGDIIALFSNHVYNTSTYDCAYWDLHSSSSWNIQSEKTRSGSFTKCSFKQGSYLALVENPYVVNPSLTQILQGIIQGDYTPAEKLYQTQNVITSYSDIFEALHIFYVAEILSHIVEVELEDLQRTAGIASNITKVDRRILAESQIEYNATDWILFHVDRIAEKFGQTAQIITENLIIIITGNITGLAIKNCDVTCDIIVLEENISLDSQENVNTALLLDSDLQSQLANSTSLLVITIYFNDALFNEGINSTSNSIGEIIGVIIPPFGVDTKGSLKFYYYTQANRTEICAFWNYTVEKDSITRGHWERDEKVLPPSNILLCESNHATHFTLLEADKNITSDLENILNSNSTIREKLAKVVAITASSSEKLSAVDIDLIAQILDYALKEVGSEEMVLTSHIISRLFHVPRLVLRESQAAYLATDRILHSIDEMAKLVNQTEGPIVQEYFVVGIYDLKDSNISGLIMEDCGTTKCNITTLKNSVNLTELSLNENLETAVALSDSLLYQVHHSKGSPKLVTTIFLSDNLFNEKDKRKEKISMVYGLLLLGLEEPLNGSVYLMYNTVDRIDDSNRCAFWNYNVSVSEKMVRGSWKSDTEPRSKEHFTICEFQHTTHFALLLANNNSTYTAADHILDVMTIVNCVLSLIGILGILLTAALFERWRKNTGNQILVHFVIAISIKIVMLYVSVAVYSSKITKVGCSITGAILHYAILSEFCWMLIIAILQFKRFVEVLGGPPKYILLKACICGWVFPLLPVTLILIIDTDNYNEALVGLCYPSGLGLYLGIWLPLIIIVAINFVIFIFIIYNVFHKKTESRDLVNHEILFQWRLALLLFSMLGLTWLFGFLGQIDGATIFVYLFCFTSTLQGFIMFLFFIVFNKSTRFLYAQAIKLWLYTKGYKIP